MARRTRTSSSGLRLLLMARITLLRVPTSSTRKRGLARNWPTLRVPARGKMSMSPAISAAVCAAESDMNLKTNLLTLASAGLRYVGDFTSEQAEPRCQLSSL